MRTRVYGEVGGPGTFCWDGYTYDLGMYWTHWIAWIRAWLHVWKYPYRRTHLLNRHSPNDIKTYVFRKLID